MVSDTILPQHTAYKGKHNIQDWWENTVYEVIEQPFKNMPLFKIKPQGGDDRVKIVHRNLLLPLLSDPLDSTNELDNSRSLVNQKKHGCIGGNCSECNCQSCALHGCL